MVNALFKKKQNQPVTEPADNYTLSEPHLSDPSWEASDEPEVPDKPDGENPEAAGVKGGQENKDTEWQWHCELDGCDRMFRRETDLRRHQRTSKLHAESGETRGLVCPACFAVFTRLDALKRHQKSRAHFAPAAPTNRNHPSVARVGGGDVEDDEVDELEGDPSLAPQGARAPTPPGEKSSLPPPPWASCLTAKKSRAPNSLPDAADGSSGIKPTAIEPYDTNNPQYKGMMMDARYRERQLRTMNTALTLDKVIAAGIIVQPLPGAVPLFPGAPAGYPIQQQPQSTTSSSSSSSASKYYRTWTQEGQSVSKEGHPPLKERQPSSMEGPPSSKEKRVPKPIPKISMEKYYPSWTKSSRDGQQPMWIDETVSRSGSGKGKGKSQAHKHGTTGKAPGPATVEVPRPSANAPVDEAGFYYSHSQTAGTPLFHSSLTIANPLAAYPKSSPVEEGQPRQATSDDHAMESSPTTSTPAPGTTEDPPPIIQVPLPPGVAYFTAQHVEYMKRQARYYPRQASLLFPVCLRWLKQAYPTWDASIPQKKLSWAQVKALANVMDVRSSEVAKAARGEGTAMMFGPGSWKGLSVSKKPVIPPSPSVSAGLSPSSDTIAREMVKRTEREGERRDYGLERKRPRSPVEDERPSPPRRMKSERISSPDDADSPMSLAYPPSPPPPPSPEEAAATPSSQYRIPAAPLGYATVIPKGVPYPPIFPPGHKLPIIIPSSPTTYSHP